MAVHGFEQKASKTITKPADSNTRRVLEVQSDLFQKNRENSVLATSIHDKYSAEAAGMKVTRPSEGNSFMQLLNKDGAWIGFFAKTVMQDSLKKGFKSVRFPAGDTAAKVEGHQTIADQLADVNKRIEQYKQMQKEEYTPKEIKLSDFKDPEKKYVIGAKDRSGSHGAFNTREEAEEYFKNEIEKMPFMAANKDKFEVQERYYGLTAQEQYEHALDSEEDRRRYYGEIPHLLEEEEAHRNNLKDNGLAKLAPIAHFYEVRLKNTLDNIYGKTNVGRVTDEHGNDWFEVGVDPIRDSEIFLQINDPELADKIEDINKQVAKVGDGYEVNGKKVAHSVDEDIRRDLEKKYRTHNEFQQALAEWRKEYSNRVKSEIGNIAHRYIDDSGLVRDEYNDSPLTSIIDPYDTTFIDTLDKWFQEKVESYPAGTRFLINKSIYNSVQDKAGFVNFVAIVPLADGSRKVDINQFKLNTPGKKGVGILILRSRIPIIWRFRGLRIFLRSLMLLVKVTSEKLELSLLRLPIRYLKMEDLNLQDLR